MFSLTVRWGKQGAVLVDDGDVPFFRRQAGDVAAPDPDGARVHRNQPGDGLQDQGLAGSRGAEKTEKLSLTDLQIDAVQGKRGQGHKEAFQTDHAPASLFRLKKRMSRKRTRHTKISHTATGWE